MMATRLQWDEENNPEEWAEAARAILDQFPTATRPLIEGKLNRVYVSRLDADRFMCLARGLPGWDDGPEYARTAILRYDDEDPE